MRLCFCFAVAAVFVSGFVLRSPLIAQPSMSLYDYRGVVACDSTSLYMWGSGSDGVITIPEPIRTYVADEGTFAIARSGNVYAWNVQGRYLLGDTADYTWHDEPTLVPTITGVKSVGGGYNFTLFLTDSGGVYGVGHNIYSHFLGHEDDVKVYTPQRIALPKKVRDLKCRSQIVALMQDGTVWTWGNNNAGIAGQDSDSTVVSPKELHGLRDVVAISMASPSTSVGHVLALTADGIVWAWGANDKGQVGNGTIVDQRKPVKVDGLTDVAAIACGLKYSIALRADGSVWAWGDNSRGQLGTGDRVSSLIPVQVVGLSNIVEVYAASSTGIAVASDGAWRGWGYNYYNMIIGAAREDQLIPAQFPHPCSVSSVHESLHPVALSAAPQPAHDELTFIYLTPEHALIRRLDMFDVRGVTVGSIATIDGSATVDVSQLPAGVYVAKAIDGRGRLIVTQRFVVLH